MTLVRFEFRRLPLSCPRASFRRRPTSVGPQVFGPSGGRPTFGGTSARYVCGAAKSHVTMGQHRRKAGCGTQPERGVPIRPTADHVTEHAERWTLGVRLCSAPVTHPLLFAL